MALISFEYLYKIHIFPKFHRCCSKIVPATPIWSLNFKRAWQAQFLSHTYEILEKCLFLIDLEIEFDIPNQKSISWKRLNFFLRNRPPEVWFHQNYTSGGLSRIKKFSLFQITDFWLGISKSGTNIIWRSIRNTYFSKVS